MTERRGNILSKKTLNELKSMIGKIDPDNLPLETQQWLRDSLDATEAYHKQRLQSNDRQTVSNSSILGFIADLISQSGSGDSNNFSDPKEDNTRFKVIGKPIINIGGKRANRSLPPIEGDYNEID